MKKMLFSLLLMAILTGYTAITAQEFAGGSGTEEDPWQIASAEHLDNIRNYTGEEHADVFFIQTADINLDAYPWNHSYGWWPIGRSRRPFSGHYNGNGHIINNLSINRSTDRWGSSNEYLGLFGYLESAVITNLGLVNSNIIGYQYLGSLAGWAGESTIEECYSFGTVTGNAMVGNLIGVSYDSTVKNCYSMGDVSGDGVRTGGLIGNNTGLIRNCYSATRVSLVADLENGGLVGHNEGEVENSFWDFEVSGQRESAGGIGISTVQMLNQATYQNWDFDEVWSIDNGLSYPYLQWQEEVSRHSIPGPVNLRGERVKNVISFNWQPPVMDLEPLGYNVYRNGRRINPYLVTVLQYDDTNLRDWENYKYQVTAVYDDFETSYSNRFEILVTDFEGGSGTEDDPYLVATAEHLHKIRHNLTAHYRQTADIDLDIFPFNRDRGWQPITNDKQEPFSGSYDGDGFVIYNLIISRSAAGLFRNVRNAALTNISLENVDISGWGGIGTLASRVVSSTVSNCYATGSILATRTQTGGLISEIRSSIVSDCWTDVEISFTAYGLATSSRVGGLAYFGSGVISNCYVLGDITGHLNDDRHNVGGLFGEFGYCTVNGSTINSCYVKGNVQGGRSVGGLVGLLWSYNDNLPSINDSYAVGKVTGVLNVGGLVGSNYSIIQRCYSQGKVTGDENTGGLVGLNNGEVFDSFWNIEAAGTDESAAGTGLTDRQMTAPDAFENWDFDNIWAFSTGASYPWLRWQEEPCPENIVRPMNLQAEANHDQQSVSLSWSYSGIPQRYNVYRNGNLIETVDYPANDYLDENPPGLITLSYEVTAVHIIDDQVTESSPSNIADSRVAGYFSEGDGTEDNPYHVNSPSTLSMVRLYLDAHYIQTADIDLDVYPWNQSRGWSPLGTSEEDPFTGSFDGNGFTITGLTIDSPQRNSQALFGCTYNAHLKNIGLVDVDVSGRDRTAGLVAIASGSTIIEDCFVTGRITGRRFTAGLVSTTYDSTTVKRCFVRGDMTGGHSTAGLVSRVNNSTTIEQCFVTGNVTGFDFIAGIASAVICWDRTAVIRDCYSTATIMTSNDEPVRAGGITASLRGNVIGNYVTGKIEIESEQGEIGAIVGSLDDYFGTVSDNYFNSETTIVAAGPSNIGNSRTTSEMIRQQTFEGFDFDTIWRIDEETSYPYLRWEGDTASNHNLPLLWPNNLEVYSANGKSWLSWDAPDHNIDIPDGYIVYRDNVRINDKIITETEFRDMDVDLWSRYHYRVSSIYGELKSIPSPGIEIKIIKFAGGNGTEHNPYLVATPEQLWGVRYLLHKHFRQTDNISLNIYPWNYLELWEPIGNSDEPFTGTYDGDFYSIEGLTILKMDDDEDEIGLFGVTEDARLKRIRLLNAYITGRNRVGGVAGRAINSLISECHVDGYLIGRASVAGIAGSLIDGSITRCFTTGFAEAGLRFSSVGGIVGSNRGRISDCYSRMIIQGRESRIGGLVGNHFADDIYRSFSTGYVRSAVREPSDVGGLIGYNDQGSVTDSYWDIETSGRETSTGGEGRSTEQMVYPYDDNTYLNWDFDDVWRNDAEHHINDGYPYLAWQNSITPHTAAKPYPQHTQEEVALDLNRLSWSYEALDRHSNPAGFRVYFNDTGQFAEDDEYEWVTFIIEQERYASAEVLPDNLEYNKTYYWKVVPTTNEPGERRAESGELRAEDQERRAMSVGRRNDGRESSDRNASTSKLTHNSQLTTHNSNLITPNSQLSPRGDAQNVPVWSFTTVDPTGVDKDDLNSRITKLQANYPNPFNPETTISFSLAEAGEVTIEIFNIRGQRVIKLLDEYKEAGNHRIIWNGRDESNRTVGSGVYLYRMKTEDYSAADRMILIK